MSATATRPTASLTVTPTQNTAPVLDFRCLYTFDLRRKQKRWQDGLARFHTFNKRVMIYDEPRNFIGDTHWREAAPIQDGDELQLDKGVLIQVGEATGKMDQDISGLFEKRRAKEAETEGSSPARGPVTQTAQSSTTRGSTTAPSQLRPKTLNALLGTPKGRIGRATLPEKSPFEERRASGAENIVAERPTKRQRVMMPTEVVPISSPKPTPKPPQGQKPAGSIHAVNEKPKPPKRQLPQNTEKAAPPTERTGSRKEPPVQKVAEGEAQARKTTAEASRARKSSEKAKRSPHPMPQQAESRRRASPEIINVDSDDKPEVSEESAPPGARLRIATSKPRKKLMYKDLLPPIQPAQQATKKPPDATVARKKVHSRPPTTSKEKETESEEGPLSQYHREQRIRLRQRLKKHDQKNLRTNHETEQPLEDEPETLFMSDDEPLPNHTTPNSQSHTPPPHAPPPSPPPTHTAARVLTTMDAILLPQPKPPSQPPPQSNPPPPPPPPPAPYPQPQPQNPPPRPHTTLPPSPRPRPHTHPLQRSFSAVTPQQPPKRTFKKTVSDSATLGAVSAGRCEVSAMGAVSVARGAVSAMGALSGKDSGGTGIGGSGMKAQGEAAPDAWSREAWDLFGVGRESFVGAGA